MKMRMGVFCLACVAALLAGTVHGDVVITELMASSTGVATNDAAGAGLDWIELTNTGAEAVDLTGWRMLDKSTKKWKNWVALPDGLSVPAGGSVLVWCDETFTGWTNGEAHVAFGLSSDGEEVCLAHGDFDGESKLSVEQMDSYISFGAQFDDVSFGRDPADASRLLFFASPTPGAANGADGTETYEPAGGLPPDPYALDPELKARLLATGLELFTIRTKDGEEPTCDGISPPPGCVGVGTTNVNKVLASLLVEKGDEILYDSGPYVKKVSGLTVKVRGNTSALGQKKPYKLKLQQPADLLYSGTPGYEDTDWNLLASGKNVLDFNVGLKVNELLGLQWTPRSRFVNLVLNGDYRGLYLLTDSVGRNPASRLNVAEDGYVFEYDAYWWNEDVFFKTDLTLPHAGYTFKYPDSDDLTDKQMSYISNYVSRVEASLRQGTYDELIDVDSFASWLLARDLIGCRDSCGANIFLTKFDSSEDSKMMMGNLWDFDSMRQQPDWWDGVHFSFWFGFLIESTNQAFGSAYQKKWSQVRGAFYDRMASYLLGFLVSDEGRGTDLSLQLDADRWAYELSTVSQSVLQNLKWFSSRVGWIDGHVHEMLPEHEADVETEKGRTFQPKEALMPLKAAQGAPVYVGAVRDSDGEVAGVVSLKVGKANLKKQVCAVSGTLTTLDGRKHAIRKTYFPIGDAPQARDGIEVKGYGTLDLTVGGDGFSGTVRTADGGVGALWTDSVTGGLANNPARFSIGLVGEYDGVPVLTNCLPLAEQVATTGAGVWKTDPAPGVKYAKDKESGAFVLKGLDDEAKVNRSALKLRYAPRMGTFKGSFKLRLDAGTPEKPRVRSVGVSVTGVTVGGRGYGLATVKSETLSKVGIE